RELDFGNGFDRGLYDTLLPILRCGQGALAPQGRGLRRDQRRGEPPAARPDGRARRRPHDSAADLRRRHPRGRVRRPVRARRRGRPRPAARRPDHGADMTGAASATFRVGLIQMRSGRDPRGNIDAAAKLIQEAKAAGADYVQTPEMTNIMEVRREALFAALAPEESDPSLAAFR